MALYESTFIVRHDMSTQQVESLAETVTTLIKDNGGEVTKTEYWGLKTLAYRIKKNRKGHYYFFNVDAPPAAVRELERNLRLNEDVLRYMTVAVEELDPNPSPMMQSRSSRDDRGRRGGGFGRWRGESGDRPRSRGEETKPANDESKPADDGSKPADDGSKPANDESKPADDGSKPADDGSKPADDGSKPADDGSKPDVAAKAKPDVDDKSESGAAVAASDAATDSDDKTATDSDDKTAADPDDKTVTEPGDEK